MSKNLIGKQIKEARLRHDPPLTQAELAVRLQLRGMNISRGGIAKIEMGVRKVSDIELVILAEILSVSTGWLLREKNSCSS